MKTFKIKCGKCGKCQLIMTGNIKNYSRKCVFCGKGIRAYLNVNDNCLVKV